MNHLRFLQRPVGPLCAAVLCFIVLGATDAARVPTAVQEMKTRDSLAGSGIVSERSSHTVDKTVDRLKKILQAKGVTLFALVDHSGEASKVGITMRPTKLLIFGNPRAGTPLMLASPSAALDLPLKILVWEDAEGVTWVSYNSPGYLQKRHNIPPELLKNISVIETLAAKAAE